MVSTSILPIIWRWCLESTKNSCLCLPLFSFSHIYIYLWTQKCQMFSFSLALLHPCLNNLIFLLQISYLRLCVSIFHCSSKALIGLSMNGKGKPVYFSIVTVVRVIFNFISSLISWKFCPCFPKILVSKWPLLCLHTSFSYLILHQTLLVAHATSQSN